LPAVLSFAPPCNGTRVGSRVRARGRGKCGLFVRFKRPYFDIHFMIGFRSIGQHGRRLAAASVAGQLTPRRAIQSQKIEHRRNEFVTRFARGPSIFCRRVSARNPIAKGSSGRLGKIFDCPTIKYATIQAPNSSIPLIAMSCLVIALASACHIGSTIIPNDSLGHLNLNTISKSQTRINSAPPS